MRTIKTARSFAAKSIAVFLALLLSCMCFPFQALAVDGDDAVEGEPVAADTLSMDEINEAALQTLSNDGGKVVQVALGGNHSAAVKADGSLWMWGDNSFGQLGDGTSEDHWFPIKVMDGVSSVALESIRSAAVKTDGSLWVWGRNYDEELGDGTDSIRLSPVMILDDVSSVALGAYHSAALKTDGSLWTWGSNDYGQLGDGTDKDRSYPVKIMESVSSVALGGWHSAAVRFDGSLLTWGRNRSGQLGDGTEQSRLSPTKVMDGISSVALGVNYSAAVKTDGLLLTWGDNFSGRLGDGTDEDRCSPAIIMEDVSSVAFGEYHSAAVKTDGSLWTWGSNDYGQLGDGTDKDYWFPAKVMEGVSSVALGWEHSAAVKSDGSLWLWGDNSHGKLGDGTTENSLLPVQIFSGDSSSITPSDQPSSETVNTKTKATGSSTNSVSTKFKIGNNFEFTIPDSVPLIGGGKIKFDLGMLPVQVKYDGNKFKLAVGVDDIKKFDEKGWTNFKQFVEKQDESLRKGLGSLLSAKFGVASMGMDVKPKISCWLYAEGTLTKNGVESVSGCMSIEIKVKASQEWQTVVVVVPVVLTLSGEVGVETIVKIGLDTDNSKVAINGQVDLTLPKLKATCGVGVAYIADISIYGSATNTISFTSEPKASVSVTGTLKGEIGVRVRVLFATYEQAIIEINDGDGWQYYSSSNNSNTLSLLSLDDPDANWQIERTTPSAWDGDVGQVPVDGALALMALGSGVGTVHTLQSSVYEGASPVLVQTASGKKVLVFVQDLPSRTDGNQTAVMWSTYNETTSTWSAPVAVDDDGTGDYNPSVCTDGESVWVAWSNSDRVFTAAEAASAGFLEACAASCDIECASIDPATGAVATFRSPSDGAYDAIPSVCADGGQVSLAWVRNAGNDPLDMSGANSVMSGSLSGASIAASAAYSTSNPVSCVSVGSFASDEALAYTVDADGDLSTLSDIDLYVKSGASGARKVASGAVAPKFAQCNGTRSLVWMQSSDAGFALASATSATSSPVTLVAASTELTPDYSVVDGDGGTMLFCSSPKADDADGSDVCAFMLDGAGSASRVELTDADGYASSPSGVFADGAYNVAFVRSDVTITEDSVDQAADLCVTEIAPAAAPSIDSVDFSEAEIAPGQSATVNIEVRNAGLAAGSGSAAVSIAGASVGTAPVGELAPGQSTTVSVPIAVPAGMAQGSQMNVECVLGTKGASKQFEVGKPNVALAADGDASGVTMVATNDGGYDESATVNVYDTDESGALLATYSLGTLAAGASATKALSQDEVAALGAESLYLKLDTSANELFTADDDASVYVGADVLKTLDHIEAYVPNASVTSGNPPSESDVEVYAVYTDGTMSRVYDFETNAATMGNNGTLEISYTEVGLTATASMKLGSSSPTNPTSSTATGVSMYRMYNPNSGEHFYTANAGERDMLVGVGWRYEGVGWTAPSAGNPVYRLYNRNGGEHHYTLSLGEKNMLVGAGWSYEGVGWYSDPAKSVPLYRQYNPNQFSCNHNYTANRGEHNWLVSLGWRDEGVGWYGIN